MISHKSIILLVITTIACATHPSILKGNTKAAEETRFCEGSLSQKLGSLECAALLRICIEGVVYKTSAMDEARLIRWQDITAWKYFGPRRAKNGSGSHQYVSLQIWERRGIKHRFNIVCGTSADGQRVFQSMKKYQPRGMIL
jgi:hypothetical protein